MAKLSDLKMFVFLTAKDIKPAKKAGLFDLKVRMGHNHDDVTKQIPTKVFIQDAPVGMVNVTSDLVHMFRNVKLDLSNPIKVRIVRVGLKNSEGEEIEVPSDEVLAPPAAPTKPPKPDVEVFNSPRDPDPGNGMFLVPLQVHKAGILTITSTPAKVDLKRNTAAGLADFPSPANVTPGFYELLIAFHIGVQVKINLQLDHGTPVELFLRK